MSEQPMDVTSAPNDLQALHAYIEEHSPWLLILGVVGEPPMLAVKDTAHLDLCVAFRTEADLAAYLATFGKPSTHYPHSAWTASCLSAEMQRRLDALYVRARAVGLCESPLEFLCCLGALHGLRTGIALSPAHLTEATLRLAEEATEQSERARAGKGNYHG